MRRAAVGALALLLLASSANAAEDATWHPHTSYGLEAPDIFAVRAGYQDARDAGEQLTIGVQTWQAAYSPAMRSVGLARIGGGDAGIDGALAVDLALGARIDVTQYFGPFLRGGIRGYYFGADRFTASLLELPAAQTGILFKKDDKDFPLLFELGARGGFAVVGRLLSGALRSTVEPSPEAGGHLAVGAGPARLELGYSRLLVRGVGARSALESFDAAACAHAGPFGGCADVRVFTGPGFTPAAVEERAHVLQAGLFFGVWLQYL